MLSKQFKAKLINLYPPYIGAGIRVAEINPEFTKIEVEMGLTRWNKNVKGVHFGGSLYAMCDPHYMWILMEHLGAEYIIWDIEANIRFKRPGRDTVRAVFEIPLARIKEIKEEIDQVGKNEYIFQTVITGETGEVVAEVVKTVYVRKKDFKLHATNIHTTQVLQNNE